MKKVKIYFEGGTPRGQKSNPANEFLDRKLRLGLQQFLQKSLSNKEKVSISVDLCGSGTMACEKFFSDIKRNVAPDVIKILLVDAESPVEKTEKRSRIEHLQKPNSHGHKFTQQLASIDEKLCHLMVQEMEAWFVADAEAIKKAFRSDFKENVIQKTSDVEQYDKDKLADLMYRATNQKYVANKEKYQKSETKLEYSGIILENLDPQKVYDKSVHFQKLQQALEDLMR